MNAVRSLLLLLPLAFVSGCLDYTEEVFVETDGTGRYKLEIATLSEFLAEEDLAELRQALQEAKRALEADPDVSKVEVGDWAKGVKHHFLFDVHAKKYSALPRLLNADAWLRLEQVEGSKQVKYVRVLDAESGSAALMAMSGRRSPDVGNADDVARLSISRVAARRGFARRAGEEEPEFFFTFKVHAPKVATSNGELGSGEATWRWRIEEMEEKAPPRLEADLDLSSRSLLPLAIGALGLGFAFLWLRKQWKNRAQL